MLNPHARVAVATIVTAGRVTPDDVAKLRAISDYGDPSPTERSAIDVLLARADPAATMTPPPAPGLGQQSAGGRQAAGPGVSATPGLARRFAIKYGYVNQEG